MIRLIPCKIRVNNQGKVSDKYCLRLYPVAPLEFDKMCDLVAERTTLTSNEVGFVLGEVRDVIIENIELGRGVDCGPLGIFALSLSAMAVETLKSLTLKTVRKVHIIYKPSLKIKKAFKHLAMRIERDYNK